MQLCGAFEHLQWQPTHQISLTFAWCEIQHDQVHNAIAEAPFVVHSGFDCLDEQLIHQGWLPLEQQPACESMWKSVNHFKDQHECQWIFQLLKLSMSWQ